MNRQFPDRSLLIVRITAAIAFLITIIVSFKLWIVGRFYPLVPLFDWLPQVKQPFDYLLFSLMAALLAGIIFFRKSIVPIYLFLILFGVQVILDQNRLQPYYYLYSLMFLSFCIKAPDSSQRNQRVLDILRIIVFGTYFWSGIHKFNTHFVYRSFLAVDNLLPMDLSGYEWLKYAMLTMPVLEVAFAIGLLFGRTRKWSVVMLSLMHLLIIGMLGIKGWNFIVIPWNVAMTIFMISLFWNNQEEDMLRLNPGRSLIKAVITILVFVMPLFNFFGLWDHYLSFSLYSYKTPFTAIFLTKEHVEVLPEGIKDYVRTVNDKQYLETTLWLSEETNTMPYPEERVYRKVYDHICGFSNDSCTAELVVY